MTPSLLKTMKRYQIRRLGYWQNIKIFMVLHFIFGLIYVPFGLLFILFSKSEPELLTIAYLFLGTPVIMPLSMVIPMLIVIAVYNGLAKFMGGWDFTLEEKDS